MIEAQQRKSTRLRIWGSEVRILPGAPATVCEDCYFSAVKKCCFHELSPWKQYGSSTHLFLFSVTLSVGSDRLSGGADRERALFNPSFAIALIAVRALFERLSDLLLLRLDIPLGVSVSSHIVAAAMGAHHPDLLAHPLFLRS